MNVTPEIVRAEMDHRIERARRSAELGQARAYRRARRALLRNAREHPGSGPAATVNGAPLAA
ncbi:MAG TPA: hypothetical protein VH969_00980 [Actinophytocola sp.]|jgi:hypothetical protein|uniref:hypothetical protein n=1 Tax=Actinophytocola sp. TaxID=1872138 RepID=UPI002F93B7C2